MKYYLAGKWADGPRLNHCVDELHALGHQITHRWMTENIGTSMVYDAITDIEGVREADVLIVIMDDSSHAYRGSFTELGAALIMRKMVIILCSRDDDAFYKTNPFFHHPSIRHVYSWKEVLLIMGYKETDNDASMLIMNIADNTSYRRCVYKHEYMDNSLCTSCVHALCYNRDANEQHGREVQEQLL